MKLQRDAGIGVVNVFRNNLRLSAESRSGQGSARAGALLLHGTAYTGETIRMHSQNEISNSTPCTQVSRHVHRILVCATVTCKSLLIDSLLK